MKSTLEWLSSFEGNLHHKITSRITAQGKSESTWRKCI
jgi:hypothetical protein